jgi:membrane protein DedA with SNARE-associated domain
MGMDSITQIVLEYRYWILIPLSFLEGPVVAFVAGTLAAAGYFNIYALAVLFFVRDLGLDGVYYAIGYYGSGTKLAKKLMHKLGITESHLAEVGRLWKHHPAKTMFLGKLSYGIASAFIVVAGIVRMPLTMFFGYGVFVVVAQYGTLLLLGYFFGNALGGNITKIIENVQYAIGGLTLMIGIYYVGSKYLRGVFIKEETHGEKEFHER